ncbi:MAG: glyoxalase [Sphingomonadaceae bacterium]|nr:glyoxalase [Sphingomonadaceae bacterium]
MSGAPTLDHVQIAIPPGGEDLARAFYADVVGLAEIPKPADMAARGGCWFALGAQQLHLGVEADFRPAKKAHVAFACADIMVLRQRLEAAGHPARDDAPVAGRTRFFADDPFGNRVEFIAEQPS